MNSAKLLPENTVFFTGSENQHLGSGILVNVAGIYYVFTASHVVHGHEKSDYCTEDIETINIISDHYSEIVCVREFGTEELHKSRDLTVLEIKILDSVVLDHKCQFTIDHVDLPDLKYVFRGKPLSLSSGAFTVKNCSLDNMKNGTFVLSTPIEFYTDGKGDVGAEVLRGYSGSGVFVSSLDGIYLVGIVQNISDDTHMGVNCACISLFSEFNIPKFELSDIYGLDKSTESVVKEIRTSVTQEMIESAKANRDKGTDLVANLSKKMDLFSPGWIESDLDEFVEDLLAWEEFYDKNIKNEEAYVELIDSAKDEFRRGNKDFVVKDKYEANNRFRKIQDDFLKTLDTHLNGFPFLEKKRQTIVSGEIAKLLGNCKINFRN
jgi:hypothetical protein